MQPGIHVAETDEDKSAVFRFRYDVYVVEMGRYGAVADHENRMLVEPEDETARIAYAADDDGRVVGTARSNWGGAAPFSERQVEEYGLAPFLAEVPAEAMTVGERGMVSPELRGTDLWFKMLSGSFDWTNEHRIQLTFGACEPHLLNVYLGLGMRTFAKRNINSPEAGYLIPLVFVPEDVEYLRRVGSPMVEFMHDFGGDARIPACVEHLTNEESAVTSGLLSPSHEYWGEVHDALSELAENRVGAFDGLSEEEATRTLGKSNIIECSRDDRVLKAGGVARNMFVVLDGTLEVRDGDTTVQVLGPGDVFGEMAFLLEQPRTKDVYAATEGVRILSLSEGTLRKAIESEPEIAATLLLNISKMLCLRLMGA